jgi:hypothetical protein
MRWASRDAPKSRWPSTRTARSEDGVSPVPAGLAVAYGLSGQAVLLPSMPLLLASAIRQRSQFAGGYGNRAGARDTEDRVRSNRIWPFRGCLSCASDFDGSNHPDRVRFRSENHIWCDILGQRPSSEISLEGSGDVRHLSSSQRGFRPPAAGGVTAGLDVNISCRRATVAIAGGLNRSGLLGERGNHRPRRRDWIPPLRAVLALPK